MTNHICLQTYLSYPLAEWVRAQAENRGEYVSVFIRDLVMAVYNAQDKDNGDILKDIDKAREIVCSSVVLDAIIGDSKLIPEASFFRQLLNKAREGPSMSRSGQILA